MAYYADSSLIVNLDNLVEAHCLTGTADYDGWYLIIVQLKHYETLKEVGAMYKTQDVRDAAFMALGKAIQKL